MSDESLDDGDETSAKTRDSVTRDGSHSDVPPVLELDEVFTALCHSRRRYLLYTLINESDEETLPALATRIAAWENDKPTDEVTEAERREVHLSLYHSHVPKLSDLGIVEYQEGTDILVRAANTEQVQAVLDGAGAELDARQETHARQRDTKGDDDADESE